MISIYNGNLTSKNYYIFLRYASKFCDTLTLWGEEYHDSAMQAMFGEHILKTTHSTRYLSSVHECGLKIYVIKLTPFVLGMLCCASGLFAWKMPFYPEDLCLFKNGKCWLETIAHEKLGYIYDDSEETKEFLRSIDVEFEEHPPVSDSEVPRLPE